MPAGSNHQVVATFLANHRPSATTTSVWIIQPHKRETRDDESAMETALVTIFDAHRELAAVCGQIETERTGLDENSAAVGVATRSTRLSSRRRPLWHGSPQH